MPSLNDSETLANKIFYLQQNAPDVTELTLTVFDEYDAKALEKALKDNTSLKSLVIKGNSEEELDEETLKIVAKIIKSNKLTSLSFFRKLNDEGMLAIAEVLKTSPALTHLTLCSTQLYCGTLETLIAALTYNTKLTYLNLGQNNLDNVDIHIFSKFLPNLNITSLDLSGNKISTMGAFVLREALEKNRSIIELNLQNNELNEDTAIWILQIIEDLLKRNRGRHNNPTSFTIPRDSPFSSKTAAISKPSDDARTEPTAKKEAAPTP